MKNRQGISLIVLIIYLLVSFATMAWYITWLIWIVYALVIEIIKLVFSVKGDYDDAEKYTPEHQACMDDAVAQTEMLIQAYFGVSDEDIAGFRDMSKARRQIVMEEGLVLYE